MNNGIERVEAVVGTVEQTVALVERIMSAVTPFAPFVMTAMRAVFGYVRNRQQDDPTFEVDEGMLRDMFAVVQARVKRIEAAGERLDAMTVAHEAFLRSRAAADARAASAQNND